MINVAVIGFGYWGPNLVRNFSKIDSCLVKRLADVNEARLKNAKKAYPFIEVTKSANDIFEDPKIDAVVIASPVCLHYEFCRQALLKNKHVLIEKPMTCSVIEALDLIDLASKKNKVLMVDHTFLYTGAVKKIKEIVSTGQIGEIQYFDSVRINLGLFQPDINVIWDLAPHDISILGYIINELPYSVIATGISHTQNKIENIAYITVNFQSSKIAHFNVSWTSPVKIRQILIGGTKKMILYNDLEPTEKVKIYDTSYKVTSDEDREKILVDYRTGDVYSPKVEQTEALSGMANDFVNAIIKGTEPVSNWQTGLNVVKILEAAEKSLKNKGREEVL
jgi:predicted dehydrogenase